MSARTKADVFRAFVDGQTADSGNVSSRRTDSGALALYSYATPIALRTNAAEPARVMLDDRRYGVTTSKQRSGVVSAAVRAGVDLDQVDHEALRALCRQLGADLRHAR